MSSSNGLKRISAKGLKRKAGELGSPSPKPSNPRKSSSKPKGRAVKHDWSAIRREYIRGDDNVTYKVLSQREGAPIERSIERKAAEENWAELRTDFRREVDTKIRSLDVDLKTEVRKRHASMGKAMTNLGGQGLQAIAQRMKERTESCNTLLKKAAERMAEGFPPHDPQVQLWMEQAAEARNLVSLDTMDIVRFIKYGTDLERKALGMEEQTINFRNISSPDDLDKLSEDQLWKLMGQLPPDELDDEDW